MSINYHSYINSDGEMIMIFDSVFTYVGMFLHAGGFRNQANLDGPGRIRREQMGKISCRMLEKSIF